MLKSISITSVFARAAAILAASAATAACADLPTASSPMATGRVALAPAGYIDFCARFQDRCGISIAGDRDAVVKAITGQQWRLALADGMGPPAASDAPNSIGETATAAPVAEHAQTGSPFLVPLAAPVVLGSPWAKAPAQAASRDARSAPAPFHLTEAAWARINRINQQINQRILPASDTALYGREDVWDLPLLNASTGRGNCKDYVLEKYRALTEQDVAPAEALSIAVLKTSWGETHAVLLLVTDRGDYVLDNLTPWILPWAQTSYRWIVRQTPGQPLKWVTVDASEGIKVASIR